MRHPTVRGSRRGASVGGARCGRTWALLLAALEFPAASDRNKTSLVLLGVIEHHPERGAEIAARAGPSLLAMLRAEAPPLHRQAYLLLAKLSGWSLGERDYAAWQAWLDGR